MGFRQPAGALFICSKFIFIVFKRCYNNHIKTDDISLELDFLKLPVSGGIFYKGFFYSESVH